MVQLIRILLQNKEIGSTLIFECQNTVLKFRLPFSSKLQGAECTLSTSGLWMGVT